MMRTLFSRPRKLQFHSRMSFARRSGEHSPYMSTLKSIFGRPPPEKVTFPDDHKTYCIYENGKTKPWNAKDYQFVQDTVQNNEFLARIHEDRLNNDEVGRFLAQMEERLEIIDDVSLIYEPVSTSSSMPFKGRKEAMNAFQQYFEDNILPYTSTRQSKPRMPFLSTLGCSRSGKSRLGDELVARIQSNSVPCFSNAICISVDFSATELDSPEHGAGEMMGTRMLYAITSKESQWSMARSRLLEIGKELAVVVDPEFALSVIRRKYGDVPIFVVIDEIMEIRDHETIRLALSLCVRRGDYQTAIFVTSLLSSTLKEVSSMSKRSHVSLPLPPLSRDDAYEIFEGRPMDNCFAAAVASCGGLPGFMEVLQTPPFEGETSPSPKAFEALFDRAISSYSMPNTDVFSRGVLSQLLLASSVTDQSTIETSGGPISIDTLRSQGYLAVVRGRCVLPLVILKHLAVQGTLLESAADAIFWQCLLEISALNLDYNQVKKGVEFEEFLFGYTRFLSVLLCGEQGECCISYGDLFGVNASTLVSQDFKQRVNQPVKLCSLNRVKICSEGYPPRSSCELGMLYASEKSSEKGVDFMFCVEDAGVLTRVFLQVKSGDRGQLPNNIRSNIALVRGRDGLDAPTLDEDVKVWMMAKERKGYEKGRHSTFDHDSGALRNGFFQLHDGVKQFVLPSFHRRLEMLSYELSRMN